MRCTCIRPSVFRFHAKHKLLLVTVVILLSKLSIDMDYEEDWMNWRMNDTIRNDYKVENVVTLNISKMDTKISLRLWVEVPMEFPWRKCVLDYNGVAAHGYCATERQDSASWLVPIGTQQFQLVNVENKRCMEPSNKPIPPHPQKNIVSVRDCGSGFWIYEREMLKWSGGGCLTAYYDNYLVMSPCNPTFQEQRFEFGHVRFDIEKKQNSLLPLDVENWRERQNLLRNEELKKSTEELQKTLNENLAPPNPAIEPRRAVVFYLDKNTDSLAYLAWWILGWKLLGLNSEKEKFDIVLFSHPEMSMSLPSDCTEYRDDMSLEGAGKCIFVTLTGISYRDHSYDSYMNSHECLVNKKSKFLNKYSHILRSDMDTFPGPALLRTWPDRLVVSKMHAYTFRDEHGESSIATALKDAMANVGLTHQGIHDICSSWIGPAHLIIRLSKLTMAFFNYLRSYLFGPGTKCRCASCIHLPQDCQWGSGIYAGTLLLYAQELAVNVLWSKSEYDSLPQVWMDHESTGSDPVCNILHIHIHHTDEDFSKFRFSLGRYKKYNLTNLDLTTVSGYSMYLALKANGQGVDEEVVSAKYRVGEDGSLANICIENT